MLAWLWPRALLWGRSRSPGVAAGTATAGLHVFSPHQDHTFDLPGNLSLQTLITWEGDVLVCVQKGEKKNRGWKQWVEGDKLHLVSPQLPSTLLCQPPVHPARRFDEKKRPCPPPLSSSQMRVVKCVSHSHLAQGTPGGNLYGCFCERLKLKGKFKMLS